MKAILNRLRRLETVTRPTERAERERSAAEMIMESRRPRLGADYKEIDFPPGWFANCRDTAERILRARQYRVSQQAPDARTAAED